MNATRDVIKTSINNRSSPIRLATVCLIGLLVAASATVRLPFFNTQPLWVDEAISWWYTQYTIDELWSSVPRFETHPPYYYLLLKGWSSIWGQSEASLRGLSSLASIVTTLAMYFAGLALGGPDVAFVAALIYALSPIHVKYAHEARPYALMCFGLSVALAGSLSFFRTGYPLKPGLQADFMQNALATSAYSKRLPWRHWVAITTGSVILLWMHNISILYVATLFAALLLCIIAFDQENEIKCWRPIKALFASGVIVFLVFMPQLGWFFSQSRQVLSDFWIERPTFQDVWLSFTEISGFSSLWMPYGLPLLWQAFATIALAGVFIIGIIALRRDGQVQALLLLGSIAILPVLLILGISIFIRPIFLTRVVIASGIPYVLIASYGLTRLRPGLVRWAAYSTILLLLCKSLLGFFATTEKEPWDQVAAYLEANADKGDLILTVPNYAALPLQYYGSPILLEMLVPLPAPYPATGQNARYPSNRGAPAINSSHESDIMRIIDRASSLFLVTRRYDLYDPDSIVKGIIQAKKKMVLCRDFKHSIVVYLFKT